MKAKEQIPLVLTHAAAELMPVNLTGVRDNPDTTPSHSFYSSSVVFAKNAPAPVLPSAYLIS